eukprot:scaffold630_cov350-Pavlova_lutheri.AAC.8
MQDSLGIVMDRDCGAEMDRCPVDPCLWKDADRDIAVPFRIQWMVLAVGMSEGTHLGSLPWVPGLDQGRLKGDTFATWLGPRPPSHELDLSGGERGEVGPSTPADEPLRSWRSHPRDIDR